jgi:uncharacterized membrane protein YhhN
MIPLVTTALVAVSVLMAGLYGLYFLQRPPSAFRTLVKVKAVGALAVLGCIIGWSSGHTWLVAIGLALSAIGDAFLADDPKRGMPLGLISFLLAHAAYVALFLHAGGGVAIIRLEPIRFAAMLAAVAGAVFVLRLTWPVLGPMKGPVLVYMLAILAMVFTAAALPIHRWSALAGALAFCASDGVLAVRLFKFEGRANFLADLAVWWLYYLGQAGIAWAFLAG